MQTARQVHLLHPLNLKMSGWWMHPAMSGSSISTLARCRAALGFSDVYLSAVQT